MTLEDAHCDCHTVKRHMDGIRNQAERVSSYSTERFALA